MAWTAPASYAISEIVTASKLNAQIRDNMKELWHEVAYTEFTTTVSSTSATLVDVVSAGAITYAGFPITVEFYAPEILVAAATGRLALIGDGVDLGTLVASGVTTTIARRKLTPTAASHTYKIQIAGTGGGATSRATAGAGGAGTNMPGFIRILEKGGA